MAKSQKKILNKSKKKLFKIIFLTLKDGIVYGNDNDKANFKWCNVQNPG